jgi:hypothetical protein
MNKQRVIFHITAGNHDWNPSEDELSRIAAKFRDAEFKDGIAVVATRLHVKVTPLILGTGEE